MTPTSYLRLDDPDYNGPDPMSYRLHAWHYLLCAEYSIKGYKDQHQTEPNMMLNVPLLFLISHAVEMLLKSALYKSGSSDSDWKSIDLRHNLSALMANCEAVGVVFNNELKVMINALSPLHSSHALRYTAFGDKIKWLPFSPSEMIELARKLIGASHPSQRAT